MKMLKNGAIATLTLVLLVGVTGAARADAAPSLGVEVTHAPTSMPRSDERLTYQVTARNTTPQQNPGAGSELSCAANTWSGAPSFAYQWLRDGASLGAANGAQTATYTVQASDEGHSLQCQVTATNAAATAIAVSAPVPAGPPPASAAPAPTNPTNASSRPVIGFSPTATGGSIQTCTAPTGWSGSPIWSFEWLRNGQPAAGTVTETTASTSKYEVAAGDLPGVLQCRAIATNAGGTAVAVSNNKNTSPAPTGAPANAVAQTPLITTDDTTSGALQIDFELPLSDEALVLSASGGGWTCVRQLPGPSQPAGASCTSALVLAPGSAAPALTLVAAIGAAVPDDFVARATFSVANAAESASVEDAFSFDPSPGFGIVPGSFRTEVLDAAGQPYSQAGGHPFSASVEFAFNTRVNAAGSIVPIEHARNIRTVLPPGFVGNPEALPQRCADAESVLANTLGNERCPAASAIGGIVVSLAGATGLVSVLPGIVYAIEPERGVPAQFAFAIGQTWIYTLNAELTPDGGYSIAVSAPRAGKNPELIDVSLTLCGFGAELGGLLPTLPPELEGCKNPSTEAANRKPFFTNPTECSSVAPVTSLSVDSWEHPGQFRTDEAVSPLVEGCADVPFEPTASLRPTSDQADSPTGLDVSIELPTQGIESPAGVAQANLKRAVVTLPTGMAVNPAAADGLAACTQDELGMAAGVPDARPVRCPEQSRIGSVEVRTPLLSEPLGGSVYLAKQGENPFGSLLALYLVIDSPQRGILVKLAGKVEPRPDGQLVAAFDDNPQFPISSLKLRFNSGNRAPLLNPPRCGAYSIDSRLSPWSAADPDDPSGAETRVQHSSFAIVSGPGGGPCPSGALEPRLNAGLANPIAASSSPFVIGLSREDGSQRFRALDVSLPPGLTAYLKEVPYCPDVALAAVSGALGSGAAELASPSCPAASQIGTVSVGAGGGTNPFYVKTGRAYLAGPYKGAPLSIAIVTPAVAGPFDLGSVVVRSAAHVDPATARITVKSDPIPTILHGIPLAIRDVRVSIDRPGFTLAPSSCNPMAVEAAVLGEQGATSALAARFQVAGCGDLAFRPKLTLQLKGATRRGGNPALRAVLIQPTAQANISRTAVILPRSAFIDNEHVNNPCTRAQYAEDACPARSIVGTATAWSPLLDEPLSGYVYFRANGGARELPDLVASLKGQVDIELVGFIDSVVNRKANTSRVRNTFALVPDAPVSRFVLNLKGGKVGLIENSMNLCGAPAAERRATVRIVAHSNQRADQFPLVGRHCRGSTARR